MQGCTQVDRHTTVAPQVEAPRASANVNLTMTESVAGQEVYSSERSSQQTITPAAPPVQEPTPIIEEEDDLNIPVNPGSTCRRKGCGITFVSDECNRIGEGEGTICTYHPLPVSHSLLIYVQP